MNHPAHLRSALFQSVFSRKNEPYSFRRVLISAHCFLLFGMAEVWARDPVTIMPIGDSITDYCKSAKGYGSKGVWRQWLYRSLHAEGIRNFDFVGSKRCPDGDYDQDNEGYHSARVRQLWSRHKIDQSIAKRRPEVAFIHIGTNDIRDDKSPAEIHKDMERLVGFLRNARPEVKIYFSTLTGANPDQNEKLRACEERTLRFNPTLWEFAKKITTAESPVTIVDAKAKFDVSKDTRDGIHPNVSGAKAIAEAFHSHAIGLLDKNRSTSIGPAKRSSIGWEPKGRNYRVNGRFEIESGHWPSWIE